MRNTLLLFVLLFIFVGGCNGCEKRFQKNNESEESIYDVIVVGGGMAGLSAGYHLKKRFGDERKILVVEKSNRVGGRILNQIKNGLRYSKGAAFGYHNAMIPYDKKEEMLLKNEGQPRGLYYNGKLILDESYVDVLNKILSNNDKEMVKRFLKYEISHKELMREINSKDLLSDELLIKIERPEKVIANNYRTDNFIKGSDLVDHYYHYLKDVIVLSTEVEEISKKENGFSLSFKRDGVRGKYRAKSVVVATPADVALKVVKEMPEKTRNFLKDIHYIGSGTVVLVVKNNESYKNFTYIATPEKPFDLVYKHQLVDSDFSVFTVYYGVNYFIGNKTGIIENTVLQLKEMGLGDFSDVVIQDYAIWENIMNVVDEDFYSSTFNISLLNPLEGVYLVGDYTMWGPDRIPYGVFQAWRSGVNVSEKVTGYLEESSKPNF
ncbi:MAG TPA: FAD-dependent oxidoreductase [bacterium]|nr:FAD-dependent oxidoreductase [bacterium]